MSEELDDLCDCVPSERWWFYDLKTGVCELGSRLLPHEEAARQNTPQGYGATRIQIDPFTQRFDPETMIIVPYTPPGPSDDALAETARDRRDALLRSTAWIRERASDRGERAPPEWLDYWQALRDLPQQTGFPRLIEWPAMPSA